MKKRQIFFSFKAIIAVLLMNFLVTSCYSFTGSSLKPDIKTISIKNFPNNTAFNPNLSQQFTVDLQNRFLQRTNLKGTTDHPDIVLEGQITGYTITPTSVATPSTSQQTGTLIQSAQNQLTINVQVHYENSKYPADGFDKTYTGDAVFNNDLTTQQIEDSQVKVATDRIINQIFNDIVANW